MSRDERADGGTWLNSMIRLPAPRIIVPPTQPPVTGRYSAQHSESSSHSSAGPSSAESSVPSINSRPSIDLENDMDEVMFKFTEIFDHDPRKDLSQKGSSIQDFGDRDLEPKKCLSDKITSLPNLEPKESSVETSVTAPEFGDDVSNDDSSFLEPEGEPFLFGEVIPGVYRSSYPHREHHDQLRGLGLKTILSLVSKDPPDGFHTFIEENGINHITIDMPGTKKVPIPLAKMSLIMEAVFTKENYPLLIHCKQGKHRTGCVVAILRRVDGSTVEEVVQEYKCFAGLKARDVDIEYIESFEIKSLPISVTSLGQITAHSGSSLNLQ